MTITPAFGDEGEASVEGDVLAGDLDLEGGEAEGVGEAQPRIGEQRIGDVLAGGELGLFGLALGADPDQARAVALEAARLSR